jgi:hypothetical protein
MIPIQAKAREKKLNLRVSNSALSTPIILCRKRRLNKTQMTAILKTR